MAGRGSPRVSHHALAGVAARDIGELAFEGGGGRPAAEPFLFYRRGDQRGVACLGRAVDDEARARQRLEGGGDRTVRIVIMRLGHAARSVRMPSVIAQDLSVRIPSSLRGSVTLFAP